MIPESLLPSDVRKGRMRVFLPIFLLLPGSMFAAFWLVGYLAKNPMLIIILPTAALVVAGIWIARNFITWRLRTYGQANNIRQMHLLATLSGMTAPKELEPVLKALSSGQENQRWKELLQQAQQSTHNPFPEGFGLAAEIYRSFTRTAVLLSAFLLTGSLVVWLGSNDENTLPFLLVMGVAIAYLGYRSGSAYFRKTPVLRLNEQGIQFDDKQGLLPWQEITDESVQRQMYGKAVVHRLHYRHKGKARTMRIDDWQILPGELRYLLLLYRNAYNLQNGLPPMALPRELYPSKPV